MRVRLTVTLLAGLLLVLPALGACQREAEAPPAPFAMTEEAMGRYCGMNVLEHAGPKGQISAQGNVICQQPVIAPFSGMQCLYYEIKCTARWKDGDTAKSKIIEGLTFNLIIEEVNECDRDGHRLLYLASIYLQVRGRPRLHLVRRSRVPGAAAHLERDARLGRIDIASLIDTLRVDIPVA